MATLVFNELNMGQLFETNNQLTFYFIKIKFQCLFLEDFSEILVYDVFL